MGGWSYSATWGSETPVPIHLKCGTCDYVHSPTPHAKYGRRRKSGWGVHMGEVVPSCVKKKIGSFSASTAYPDKRAFSLSASKNVFRWWVLGSICRWGQIFTFFAPQNHFQWAE